MVEKVIEAFNKYTSNYDKKVMEINLKYNHSFSVMELMGELAFRLDLDKEKIELARVIGLLHDIGRFEQFKKYNSFSDKNVDHADVGADYLFKDGHIRDFIDDDKYDSIIECAIRNHNKLEISNDLSSDELLFTKMIRDMDKVDIYKQDAINYSFQFNASEVTSEVLMDLKEEKNVDIKKRKTKSDATLVVLSFIFDMNFNESYDILVETDNFDLFLSTIEVSEDSENLFKKVKEICFDKINRGMGDEDVRSKI